MGTKFAPVYATLVMGCLEEKLYNEIKSSFEHYFSSFFTDNWKRFLDVCFIHWTKSENELKQLHQILNTFGKIETDIYYEETDSKQHLLFSSCHPHHTKVNIPFSLSRRLRVIVSDKVKLMQRFNELKKYPEQLIDNGIKRALEVDLETLREKVPLKNENIIPYASTYNPRNPELFPIIKSNLPILYQDNKLKDLMKKRQIIKSKR